MPKSIIGTTQTQFSKFCKVFFSFISAFAIINLSSISVPVRAAVPGDGIFKAASDGLFEIVKLMVTYVVTPVAVLALIILIIQIIWGMVAGETHHLGKKIGWAVAILILVIIALYIGANANTIFTPK
jgi:hypothetical protein